MITCMWPNYSKISFHHRKCWFSAPQYCLIFVRKTMITRFFFPFPGGGGRKRKNPALWNSHAFEDMLHYKDWGKPKKELQTPWIIFSSWLMLGHNRNQVSFRPCSEACWIRIEMNMALTKADWDLNISYYITTLGRGCLHDHWWFSKTSCHHYTSHSISRRSDS